MYRVLSNPASKRLWSSPKHRYFSPFLHNDKMPISYDLLSKQNAETSNAIIDQLQASDKFVALAQYEGKLTVDRDEEDAVKLQKGIDFAKEKGVIDPNFEPEPYVMVDVLGKTPEIVAQEILEHVNSSSSSEGSGGVIVLVGLSGTGKGTTVALLKTLLEKDGKQVTTWSNGNIFRAVTLLAATYCEQNGGVDGSFDKDLALTPENLKTFVSMLEFGKFNGKYDTKIEGLGIKAYISEIQNTELKSPKVSKNIPTVAEFTQGEVILFAAAAVETMGKDGIFVLLEGREQTVNYVRTPNRFTLMLSDDTLIGKRRAAQRLMADALAKVEASASEDDVSKVLEESLTKMHSEMK